MSKKKSTDRRKPGMKGKIFLALVTTVNLALTLALSLQRRREVLRAVAGPEGKVRVLAERESDFTKPAN